MNGPHPSGTWTRILAPAGHQFLEPGKRYRIVRGFTDYDRHEHPVGEEWVYLTKNFSPHEDGLSLFVSLDGLREWHIPMQWLPEAQGDILSDLKQYIVEV